MLSIFVPKRRGEASKLLKDVGAGWALDRSVTAMGSEIFENGPDGGPGTLVHFDRHGRPDSRALTVIDVEKQNWQPAAPQGEQLGGAYWVGYWREHKPGPEDLEREDLTDGIPLQLRDGNEWLILIADYLPRRMGLNRKTGKQELRPLPEHMPFIDKTNALFEYLISDEFQKPLDVLNKVFEVVIPQGLAYAAEALGKNYRVNIDLVADDMLDLIEEFTAVKIAGIATALEVMAGAEKKSTLLAMASCDS